MKKLSMGRGSKSGPLYGVTQREKKLPQVLIGLTSLEKKLSTVMLEEIVRKLRDLLIGISVNQNSSLLSKRSFVDCFKYN